MADKIKIPQLGSLSAIEIYFSQFWKLEIQDQGVVDPVSGESPRLKQLSFLCDFTDGRGKDLPKVTFIKALISLMRALLGI